jgi:polysaccharide export outer membrane protein
MRPALVVLLGMCAASGAAQSPSAVMEEAGRANLPAQRLGVDDLVAVSVYRSPELTRTLRVESGGNISLPLLRRPVRAEGLLPVELETAIAGALKAEGILVNPVVKVTVAEYASRPISVMGAVRRPLTFQAVGRVTLLDALARAEGLSPEAASEIIVSRPGEADAAPLRIPVRKLIDAADPAVNLRLRGGEEIRVPEAGRLFVVGNVRKPGSFPLKDSSEATLMKALAMAEGLAPFAAKMAYVYREDAKSKVKTEIPLELDKIMQRKLPDVALMENDVVYVPDNRVRRATMNVIDRVTSFGASTASGVLIWRR